MEATHDRPDGHILDFRDFPIFHPLNSPEKQNGTVFRLQTLNRLLQSLIHVLPVETGQIPGRGRLIGSGLIVNGLHQIFGNNPLALGLGYT